MEDPTIERFWAQARAALEGGRLLQLLLANPTTAAGDLARISARPVVLRGQPHLSLTLRHATRDDTRNLLPAPALAELAGLLGPQFRNAHLFTPGQELQLALSRKGRASLRTAKAAPGPAAGGGEATVQNGEPLQAHNREKLRPVPLGLPFLQALGVADAQGALVPAMARKFKQINRFVEVLAGALSTLPTPVGRPLRVADVGCGRGYLTFAVHHHLAHTLGRPVEVLGVELRPDLVAETNGIVQRLGLQGLRFEAGDLGHWRPAEPLDVMIALHACDTATDLAMHLGLQAGARVIVCSPCCHKQLRPQLLAPSPLKPLLQHGIHLGQEAEMVTDGLRALLLQAQGYATQVFEFISLEHTAKNKMILAVKGGGAVPPREEVLAQIAQIKGFYGIREQALEQLLAG